MYPISSDLQKLSKFGPNTWLGDPLLLENLYDPLLPRENLNILAFKAFLFSFT